jgi:4-alpha-glucanotransferase
MTDLFERRRAGLLLHPTSLPGSGATGTFGDEAYRFVDFLRAGGFTVWQTLPLGPVDTFGSPYCLGSAYAGDIRLIDPNRTASLPEMPAALAAEAVVASPAAAYAEFNRLASPAQLTAFARFMGRHRRWVFAYGMFELCRSVFDGAPWWHWPYAYRERDWDALVALVAEHKQTFRATVFQQYLFDLQWAALKRYANDRGIHVFGDLPFYLDRNSVEVWWNRRFFALDDEGCPRAVAGVPPDYFNAEGQLWGNPLYDWPAHAADGFEWWRARIARQLQLFDLLRIDHFRALESYWSVPADAVSAREGHWEQGCGDALLGRLSADGELPLVAEDLGIITDSVRELRDRFALPGMAVVQFAFDGALNNPHLPANVLERSVFYTGTHDNDTLHGWYASLDDGMRDYVRAALGAGDRSMPEFVMDAVYASRAKLAVVPLQDLLGLGAAARMNTPGRAEGNWRWRFEWSELPPGATAAARERARLYRRDASPAR